MSEYLFHPYTRFSAMKDSLFPHITHGEGIYLYDKDEKAYMDIISSWWACSLGHNYPAVVRAIQEQASKLQHSITGSMTHPNVLELSKRLAYLMPTPDRHCLFASDGSSSVEAALKIALQYWHNINRPEKKCLMGMDQAYHGDSLGALSVGFVDEFHNPYQHVISTTTKLPFPLSTPQDPDGFQPTQEIIKKYAHELAAIIVEPLCLGSAGMKFYSIGYLKKLAAACKEYEILLIVDEIAMGFGRTGQMFAFNHAGIDPDIVCVGKAITAGYMPLSVSIIKDELYQTFSDLGEKDCTFYHGNTYAGHPIGCAAALAALDVYETENLILKSHSTADYMQKEIYKMGQLDCVKNIRSLGMIGVVELQDEYQNKIPYIKQRLIETGYLFRPLGTTFYFMPPLIITENQLEDAIHALQYCLESL